LWLRKPSATKLPISVFIHWFMVDLPRKLAGWRSEESKLAPFSLTRAQ